MTSDLPPRWRIRRTWDGRWEVRLRYTFPSSGLSVHPSLGAWDTWANAIAYVQRVQTSNYGRAA